jgi:hypothetical protein
MLLTRTRRRCRATVDISWLSCEPISASPAPLSWTLPHCLSLTSCEISSSNSQIMSALSTCTVVIATGMAPSAFVLVRAQSSERVRTAAPSCARASSSTFEAISSVLTEHTRTGNPMLRNLPHPTMVR